MSGGVGGCRGAIPVTRPDQRASRGSRLKATSETMAFRHSVQRTPITQRGAAKLSHYPVLIFAQAARVRALIVEKAPVAPIPNLPDSLHHVRLERTVRGVVIRSVRHKGLRRLIEDDNPKRGAP